MFIILSTLAYAALYYLGHKTKKAAEELGRFGSIILKNDRGLLFLFDHRLKDAALCVNTAMAGGIILILSLIPYFKISESVAYSIAIISYLILIIGVPMTLNWPRVKVPPVKHEPIYFMEVGRPSKPE
jgi:hypothetical protein